MRIKTVPPKFDSWKINSAFSWTYNVVAVLLFNTKRPEFLNWNVCVTSGPEHTDIIILAHVDAEHRHFYGSKHAIHFGLQSKLNYKNKQWQIIQQVFGFSTTYFCNNNYLLSYHLYLCFTSISALFPSLPAVWVSSGCVAESEEPVINERQQQAPLATVKNTWHE